MIVQALRYYQTLVFSLFPLLVVPHIHAAACHAVTPSGSGTKDGSNWTNACAGFSGTCSTAVRGDTYYLADGNYGSSMPSTIGAASGSTITTIKKASDTGIRDGDHGQNCSPSIATGWDGSTMGSSTGQATFTGGWDVSGTSYLTLDGGNAYSSFGCGPYPCGIFMDRSGCSGTCDAIHVQDSGANGADHLWVKYVEFRGQSETNHGQDFFFYTQGCCGGTVATQILISHTVERENYASNIQFRETNGYTAEYNIFYREALSSTFHGEVLSEAGSSNIIFRYNLFVQDGGTGVLVVLSDNTSFAYTTTNMAVYGNIFFDYPNNNSIYGQTTDNTITCINPGITCTNFLIVNNTFAGFNNENLGSPPQAGYGSSGDVSVGNNWTCQNNLWYNINTTSGANPWNMHNDCFGGAADYDTVIFSGTPSGWTFHAHDIKDVNNTNPFTRVPTAWPDLGDWHLPNNIADVTSGNSVPSSLSWGTPPYTGCTPGTNCPNIDPDGVARGTNGGWSRGAFQFGTATAPPPPVTRPQPPVLSLTVQ